MDYNSIHGPGISNFSSPSPHRMPTVSAAQALQDLNVSPTRCISTGLRALDAALQSRPLATEGDVHGGVSRGKVTEIYGPPGVGKTALGMQMAAGVLHAGEGVIWVDASHPLPGARLAQFLTSYRPLHPPSQDSKMHTLSSLASNLTHFSTPTLSHLIALLANPTPTHPPNNTSLIIIDSFSTLISNAFPKNTGATVTPRKPGAPNPSVRKFPILQYIINALSKLAATRSIAIVVFSQCVTKMRPGLGAVLIPAVNTPAWEQGLACRVALFRDWGWDDEDGTLIDDVRLVKVIKAEGVAVTEGRAKTFGFTVCEAGVIQLTLPARPTQIYSTHLSSPLKGPYSHPDANPEAKNSTKSPREPTTVQVVIPQKRKLSATALDQDHEIPDSDAEDDEDYGWGEEDEEELPPPPPQWQGSEDILIPDPAEVEREMAGEELEDDEDELGDHGRRQGAGGIRNKRQAKTVIADSDDEDELA